MNKVIQKIGLCIVLIATLGIAATSGCVDEGKTTIKVSGAFALYPMMGIWADEYEKTHPGIRIDVAAGGAGKGMADALQGVVDIGMVSRGIFDEEIEQGAFWVSVTKDAVVATINSDNPALDSLLRTGITQQQLVDIFITRELQTWGQVVGDPNITGQIRVYTRSDACGAAQTWAEYLGNYSQNDLTQSADAAIEGDPNLAAVIQGETFGIGFNNINFVYDHATDEPYEGLLPIPLDTNGNGVLDGNESFYGNLTSIVDAIDRNAYPSPPARELNLVAKHNFTGEAKNFVYWILTDGQQYVPGSGYIQLSQETIEAQIAFLEAGDRP